jgi:1,2-dihydroxy-3-keto-5-methylthiopentene dioxygenase
MAVLRFPMPHLQVPAVGGPEESSQQIIDSEVEIRAELAAFGIQYERWSLDRVSADASADDVLAAYADEIEEIKRRGGYITADVIDVNAATPGLDAMLARFDKEHTHAEDEVRFILSGRGIFFFNFHGRIASCEVGPGDMLNVPRGTFHWFTLCEEKTIRAIRWFQDTAGWTPNYTASGVDQSYQPLCFGLRYIGARAVTGLRV